MFKKALFFLLISSILTSLLSELRAQGVDTVASDKDTLWKKGALMNINISQVALENWNAGGQNSISLTGATNLFADYRKGKINWKNSVDMSYGILSQQKSPFIKNDDEIEFASKLSRRIQKDLHFSGRIDFRSQFAPGYEFPELDSVIRSDFLAPGYAKGMMGIDYVPGENFTMTLSPAATKITIVKNQELADRGAFGVEPGENVRYEFGGNLNASIRKTILPNTRLRSDIALFSNYLEEPGNLDINFSLLLNMKVNSFLTASISTDMIYDDDIMIPVDTDDDGIPDKSGPRLQFKEVLNIGLSFDIGDVE